MSHAAAENIQGQALEISLRILRGAVAADASDVHLKAGSAPMVRIDGDLCPLDHPALPEAVVQATVQGLAGWSGVEPTRLREKQVDFSVQVPDVGRFRVHAYRQNGTFALALRHIPFPVPDFATLRIPPVVKRIALLDRGLVLVTGATGNGKSTTIAAMLQFVNQNIPKHIVTVEDPVEYIFEDEVASFSQRELGRDVDSYDQGLEGAMREDPDIIFLGEIRTFEQFDLALNAAESGRLVISTFHSQDAMRAVQRMVNFYPVDQRDALRNRIADALGGVVCQRLVAKRGGRERILITEVLTRSPTVSDCIRDASRLRGLTAALDKGTHEYGSHSFDAQLLLHVRDGHIALETAKAVASNPSDLARNLKVTDSSTRRGF